MGLNTIAFYVFWNDHEQPDGSFDFKTGNRDLAAFLKLCQEEGMWVLFRPGPYVCGEWDLGGLPHYLLKDPKAKLRTTEDAKFMKAQARYLEAVARVAEPFLAKNGGPILMTQLENEYGSYQRKDPKYMEWLKTFWTRKGFGPFYTSDGAGEHYLKGVTLPGVAVGLDPGLNDGHWKIANKCNPGRPCLLLGNVSWLAEALGGRQLESDSRNCRPRALVHGQGAFFQPLRFSRGHQFRLHGGSQ